MPLLASELPLIHIMLRLVCDINFIHSRCLTIMVTMWDKIKNAPVIQLYRLVRTHLGTACCEGRMSTPQQVASGWWRLMEAVTRKALAIITGAETGQWPVEWPWKWQTFATNLSVVVKLKFYCPSASRYQVLAVKHEKWQATVSNQSNHYEFLVKHILWSQFHCASNSDLYSLL